MRGKSQLELAMDAMTTPRYVSFVETGRSQPSRRMVVRLARALDVPLRERNGLLLAAGYAPLYSTGSLDGPELDRVQAALGSMLAQHEPFPAVVMDRGWNVLRPNGGAVRLFGGLCTPQALPDPANVLSLMIEPGPVRDAVLNWDAVVPTLLERARREAVGGVLDPDTATRIDWLRSRADVTAVLSEAACAPPTVPVLDVQCSFQSRLLLGRLDHRHTARRHRPRAAPRGVLPRGRCHAGGVDRAVVATAHSRADRREPVQRFVADAIARREAAG